MSVCRNACGSILVRFLRKKKVREDHLRLNSFLCSILNMKGNGSKLKGSFCAVIDVILSTFHKKSSGYQDLGKNHSFNYCICLWDGYTQLRTAIHHFKMAADYKIGDTKNKGQTLEVSILTKHKTSYCTFDSNTGIYGNFTLQGLGVATLAIPIANIS